MPVPFDRRLSVPAQEFHTIGVSHVFEELADDFALALVEPRNALEKPMLPLIGTIESRNSLHHPLPIDGRKRLHGGEGVYLVSGPFEIRQIRRTRQSEPPD